MLEAILNDETLSDEEKQRKIEQIDAATKEKLARISSEQVAAESSRFGRR